MLQTGENPIWIQTPLALLNLTLSTMVGVAGAAALNTDRFADIVAEATVYTTAKEILGAATPEDTLAAYKIDPCGAELVQVQVAVGNATSINAMVQGF